MMADSWPLAYHRCFPLLAGTLAAMVLAWRNRLWLRR